jgi:hypothetical protein
MVGVVCSHLSEIRSVRTIRKDVLDCLFGKPSAGLLNLIDESMKAVEVAARATSGPQHLDHPVFGLVPGELRATQARSPRDLLETACLLYSSLVNLDRLDEADENDAPQHKDVSRRFGTEVRIEVLKHRPDLWFRYRDTTSARRATRTLWVLFTSRDTSFHCSASRAT